MTETIFDISTHGLFLRTLVDYSGLVFLSIVPAILSVMADLRYNRIKQSMKLGTFIGSK